MRFTIVYRVFIFLSLSLFLGGCKKSTKEELSNNENEEINTPLLEEKTFIVSEKLSEISQVEIKEWKEYNNLRVYLKEVYLTASPVSAMDGAEELLGLVKSSKDSMRIDRLNVQAIYARLNTLESEVMRLKDMSTIPSIKAVEVHKQTAKMMAVFSALNSKINAIYSLQTYDDEVEFDESMFDFSDEEPVLYKESKKKR